MGKNNNRKQYFLVFIIWSVVLISYLHYSSNPAIHDLHNVLAELYYLPLLVSALIFGRKGALITYIVISVSYLPHVVMNWSDSEYFFANQMMHGLFSGIFALLAGHLVDRERKNRAQSERDRYLTGLGQASAAIVHDLKNPLISILGFARRLKQGKGDISSASEAIIRSAEDMEKIVHGALDFSRPVKADLSENSVGDILNGVYSYCRIKAEQNAVVLSVSQPDPDRTVMMDRTYMTRALINLVNNAIEASGRVDVVEISAGFEGDRLNIKIKDHGAGMDRETIENVFIPFYTRKSSGTGLGMAIAKKVIEGHGGDISIKSREGLGTEVTVRLPCGS